MDVTRLFDLPAFALRKYARPIALSAKSSGRWIKYSHADLQAHCDSVSYALLKAGIRPGDHVACISGNRPEWNFADIGIMQAGAVHVPVCSVISDEDLVYILHEACTRIVFAGDNHVFLKLNEIRDKLPCLERIIAFDKVAGADHFWDFISGEREAGAEERLERIKAEVKPEDLATIIYTSGTAGKPKGVKLSHHNIVSNFKALSANLKIGPGLSTMSYLPLCHIFERMLNYMFMYRGVTVFYAESQAGISDNIREVKPDIITTVPLLLEKIYGSITSTRDILSGYKRRIFNGALAHAAAFPLTAKPGLLFRIKQRFYDILVYKKWRAALGGRLLRVYCGGAALQTGILKLFWAAGMRVYEGYGLTETSPVITSNTDKAIKPGTVGMPLDGVELMISGDGEILTKGPCLMMGYHKDPQLTAEVIDADGWFHTGDIGELVDGKFLRITGRKKVLFKTTSGEYVVPERIEDKLKESPFISQALVAGENRSFLGALIVPDFNYILSWFDAQHLPFGDDETLAGHTMVRREIEKAVWEYNRNALETERIGKYKILAEEWTVENGALTPKTSLRRNVIQEKYQETLDGFFDS